MKRYILITNHSGAYDVMSLIINTDTVQNAIIKAYEYFGGRVKQELFIQAMNGMDCDNALELFELMTGDNILYFALEQYGFKYGLTEI